MTITWTIIILFIPLGFYPSNDWHTQHMYPLRDGRARQREKCRRWGQVRYIVWFTQRISSPGVHYDPWYDLRLLVEFIDCTDTIDNKHTESDWMWILVDFPCVCVWHESIGYNVNIYPEQVVRGECTIRPGRKPSCEEAKAGGRHNQPSYGGPCKVPWVVTEKPHKKDNPKRTASNRCTVDRASDVRN